MFYGKGKKMYLFFFFGGGGWAGEYAFGPIYRHLPEG